MTRAVLADHRERQLPQGDLWGEGWQDTGLVFTRENDAILSPELVSCRFKHPARQASVPVIRFQYMRHTSASLAQSGATLAEVMRRAGHSSSRAAMIYQHAAERRDAKVAARLGRLAAGTTPHRTGT